jgi:hypothetical protein
VVGLIMDRRKYKNGMLKLKRDFSLWQFKMGYQNPQLNVKSLYTTSILTL